jgi:hypothetical protein
VFATGLLVTGIGSLTLIARELGKAPEGYEDEHGFHIVRKRAVPCSLLRVPRVFVVIDP